MEDNVMEIKEFAEVIREEVARKTGSEVRVQQVMKNNNVKLYGLTILEEGCNVSPTIYMEPFFSDYENDRSIDSVVSAVMELAQDNKVDITLDMNWFRDFEQVRGKLRFKLVNYERNKDLLKKVPHTRYLDLAKVYYVSVDAVNFGSGTILVYDSHMEMWGVTTEQLETIACENTCNQQSVVVKSMQEVLDSMIEMEEDIELPEEYQLYVMSNHSRTFGACTLCNRGALKELAKELDSDLIILPSSVHEIIVKPTSGDLEELLYCKAMVREVNRTQVTAEEFLSDSIYFYDRETNSLSIA